MKNVHTNHHAVLVIRDFLKDWKWEDGAGPYLGSMRENEEICPSIYHTWLPCEATRDRIHGTRPCRKLFSASGFDMEWDPGVRAWLLRWHGDKSAV